MLGRAINSETFDYVQFPSYKWRMQLDNIKIKNIKSIEWCIGNKCLINTYQSSQKIKKIFLTVINEKIDITGFLLNCLMENNFNNNSFKRLLKCISRLDQMTSVRFILPVFFLGYKRSLKVINDINKIFLNKRKKLIISIECEYKLMPKYLNYIKKNKLNNVFFTLDVANLTYEKKFHYAFSKKYLLFTDGIHLKDRDTMGINCIIGKGIVKWKKFFDIIHTINYKKFLFTIEKSPLGNDWYSNYSSFEKFRKVLNG